MTDGLMMRAALMYAEQGWRVIPIYHVDQDTRICGCENPFCNAPGKHPRIGNWTEEASTNEWVIRGWWDRWPNANVGVACGEKSNLIVVDIDLDDGVDGFEELRTFVLVRGLAVPQTLAAETGSGGQHLFFRWSEGISNVIGWLPSVDVKSDGGYVLMAPSNHVSGNAYSWLNQSEIADLGPLVEHLRSAKGTPRRSGARGVHNIPPYSYRDAVKHGPPMGVRDHFFNARAFDLRKSGTTREQAEADLRRIWELTPQDDPFPWEVALDKLERVWRKVEVDPLPEWDPWAAEVRAQAAERVLELELPSNEPLTERGNARRLVNAYGHRLLHSRTLGWLLWDDTHWALDDTDQIYRIYEMVLRRMRGEWEALSEEDEGRDALLAWIKRSEGKRHMSDCIAIAGFQSEIAVSIRQLDANPYLLACPNGTVNLATGEVVTPSPVDWITHRSEVTYVPEARSELWERFLYDVTGGDGDLLAYLQRAVGYTLTADTTEDALFFIYGPPGSGKSTFLDALITILGPMSMTVEADLLTHKVGADSFPYSEVANMRGKRLVAVSETEEGARLKETLVKKMSGGDKLIGRHLYRDRFEFSPTHKLWIVTNHLPRIFSEAMWRRIKAVPFPHRVPNPDYRIRAMAKEPSSELAEAALAWAVRGAMAWRAHRLGTCAIVQAETAEYAESQDKFGRFLEEETIVDPTGVVASRDLYQRYSLWCQRNGERAMTSTGFGIKMRERGTFKSLRLRGVSSWEGLELRSNLGVTVGGTVISG